MFDGLGQFLAFIGAVVCLVVVIGGAYRLWQLGVRGWLDALNARVARVYWKVPKRTLVVLPAQAANVWWEMGQKDGAPCMQVVGEFFFTNISSEPVLVPKTSLVVYGARYWFIPTSHRVEGNILVRQAQGYLYGHTDIPSRGLTEGRADWLIIPPVRQKGERLQGRACFIDGYGNEHWTPMIAFAFRE